MQAIQLLAVKLSCKMFRNTVRIYNNKEKMLSSHFKLILSDNELHFSLQFLPVGIAFLGVDED